MGPDLGRRPTLSDVARLAGVSPSTVSRVVRGAVPVSTDLERVVRRAIAETGYVPNLAARQLVVKQSETIGVIVFEDQRHVFGEPFFGELLHGIVERLASTPYRVILMVCRSADDRAWLEHFIGGGHVDGVMVIAPQRGDPLGGRLKRLGVPIVFVGRPFGMRGYPFVDADNPGGVREAVRHLCRTGRSRIAAVTGVPGMRSSVDRLEGYRLGLADAGLTPDERLVVTSDYTELGGQRAVEGLLREGVLFDAVVAASDLVAFGALRALRQAAIDVPGEVAVVGFGDDAAAARSEPPLTTVRQPVEQLGQAAAEALVTVLGGGTPQKASVLPTELVVRATS